MEDLDLNIDNYDLDDILNLFRLPKSFDDNDLKRAYKITLMTHPDKSHLDKKFFLFFTKAFKLLKQIHDFSNKHSSCSDIRNSVYDSNAHTKDEHKELVEKIKSKKNFNKWFNEMFEQLHSKDDETDSGYESWLQSNDDVCSKTVSNMSEMGEVFESQKKDMRALIVHQSIEEMNYAGGTNLTRNKIENYGSDIFSKLQYEDLKKAHTETVVPVTHEDFLNRKHFKSHDELLQYRTQNESIPDKETSERIYENIQTKEKEENITRAYQMAKQYEQTKKVQDQWWSNMQHLTYTPK